MNKKIIYIKIDETTTIEELAKRMIEEKKKGFIAKATFHKIELSSENFSTEKDIIFYYKTVNAFYEDTQNSHALKEEQIMYPEIKSNIKESINEIDFSNPNNILEWLYKACYYTDFIDTNEIVVKLLALLKENQYVAFDEFSRNYHKNNTYDNDLPHYLISQCIICLEDFGFLNEFLIDSINIYMESLEREINNSDDSNKFKSLDKTKFLH